MHRQQTIWLKVKAAMLAGHARNVRQELASQKSLTAELELAAVQQQVQGLQEMVQQQQGFARTLEQVCQVRPGLPWCTRFPCCLQSGLHYSTVDIVPSCSRYSSSRTMFPLWGKQKLGSKS